MGINLGESYAEQDQGSRARRDKKETQKDLASVESESVIQHTLHTKSTEEEEGVLGNQKLPWDPRLKET